MELISTSLCRVFVKCYSANNEVYAWVFLATSSAHTILSFFSSLFTYQNVRGVQMPAQMNGTDQPTTYAASLPIVKIKIVHTTAVPSAPTAQKTPRRLSMARNMWLAS